jgi:hypothetical protein
LKHVKANPHATTTAATVAEAIDLGIELAPEDPVAALDFAKMAIIEGRVRTYTEREPGTPGAWRIDDDAAIAAIKRRQAEHPDWPLSRVMLTEFPGAPERDRKRWRERLKESFR